MGTKDEYGVRDNLLFILRSISKFDKSLFFILGVNIIFSGLAQVVPIFFPRLIIDNLIDGSNAQLIINLAIIFGIALVITNVITDLTESNIFLRFITIRFKLTLEASKKFMSMNYSDLEDPEILDLSYKGRRATAGNQGGIEGIMHRMQWASGKLISIFITGGIIIMLNPLLIIALILIELCNYNAMEKARRIDKDQNDRIAPIMRRYDYLYSTMTDFSAAKDIRLFGMKDILMKHFQNTQESKQEEQNIIWKCWRRVSDLYTLTTFLQEILLYMLLVIYVLRGRISVGEFTMYISAVFTLSGLLRSVFDDWSFIKQQSEIVTDFRMFMDLPDLEDGAEPVPLPHLKNGFDICFNNVSFRYYDQPQYALKNISVTIPKGQKVAVIGLNGAGKTTFVKLLARLYEPQIGQIKINGMDTANWNKREYYQLFSIVFQDINLLAFSLEENITMQIPELINDNRLDKAIRDSGLKKRVDALPRGVKQSVSKIIDLDGVDFSGGEKQKIALARVLYKETPVVILDEPTAALDPLAEEMLYKQFDELVSGKTAIYISHRLSSTKFCDRILLFEEGRIIEDGNHEELMKKDGKYAALFRVQSQYYKPASKVGI